MMSTNLSTLSSAGNASETVQPLSLNSYDEFTRLREVIVGDAHGAQLPELDRSAWLNLYGEEPWAGVVTSRPFDVSVVEESQEDLADLTESLVELGVDVKRPTPRNHSMNFGSGDWESTGFYSYCPRDLSLIVGQTIIETPSPMRARYFESFSLRDIFAEYARRGATWLAAPKPMLQEDLYHLSDDGIIRLTEAEIAFEAANVLRCGRDIFYQVSASGNEAGADWLERTLSHLGDFQLHRLRGIYEQTHIDSTIAFLRPGLVLLNPSRVNETNLPDVLRGWDILWCPDMDHPSTRGPQDLSSQWIGMNLLMVAEDTAIVDASQTALMKALERKGISVVPQRIRHARALGGGVHCVTLDTVRDGQLVNYF